MYLFYIIVFLSITLMDNVLVDVRMMISIIIDDLTIFVFS